MLKWVVGARALTPTGTPEIRKRLVGSDPRSQTCRSKLQCKRSKLNQEINKELMLRAGAENLFKATTNKKLRETVALELSFVNSNLQLLKEQLAELNSSVDVYQGDGSAPEIPMIPLGLKETKDIDVSDQFKDFIMEHYSEDPCKYESAIQEFIDLRQAIRTPSRDESGIALLFEYFNQLYFIERRFFPPERTWSVYFEWYDSLTGVPSCQRTVAFEKASILFNIGAVYTQIGARQNRGLSAGLESAVDNFLRAAGTFKYILENFTNAPSMDLRPDMLEMLVQLMLAQGRECLFSKISLGQLEDGCIDTRLELGQEACQVSAEYDAIHGLITKPSVKDYVPYSWISLIHVKREHYKAIGHFLVGTGLLDNKFPLGQKTKEAMAYLHKECNDSNSTFLDITVPQNQDELKLLGRAHLRESVLLHEEALRVHRMCRRPRKQDLVQEVLKTWHTIAIEKYSTMEEEDDFQEILDPLPIDASTKYQLTLTSPDFSQYKVEDLFNGLGPVAIFSAKHHWTAPRDLRLDKLSSEGFGFSVRGDAPVIVAGVDSGGLADMAGMKEGDFIVGIGDIDCKWLPHEEVVNQIKSACDKLTLKLVTPMDRNYLKPKSTHLMTKSLPPTKWSSPTSTSSSSSSSGVSSLYHSQTGSLGNNSHKLEKKLTWNLFKKARERRRSVDDGPGAFVTNVIVR